MNNKINELVLYYENNKENIKNNWNETETRIELINPLFECLGWDINNTQKLADPFKEVKHEASLKIGSNIKAPDYSFNYGKKIFYLEAKKPSVDIKHDIHPAYQLRRYGWTAKLPISILTDFEELSIYDCRVKPDKNDNAGIARLKFYTVNDYINKWNEIYNFISKEAILHGSLNEFENKQIKGTASIDDDFLNFIEDIRKLLALDIAKKNPDLSENDFNFAIQMIIDRIIFIRICEDRGIENYESLKDAVSKDNCYINLIDLFQKADIKYNSGLFHFKKESGRDETPDSITQNLKIDDKVLKEIIKGFYYPDCPFALDVIGSDVLGSVYERFLGKVITLSETHKAKIDYKPEVRKAGGVYYTPHYIVEYIVNNTVGELVKNKTPDQINKIKILDPACGSGSFLVEAYQYLLDHHLNYYHNNEPDKWKKGKEPKIFESQTGLHLTLSERKRILLNNIFGVDIDKQAVEVTKLSLLLKVLEYEGLEVKQKSLFEERVLPDLYKNIKCGNSLIGSDFYKEKDLSLFGNDEMQKVNAFDWDIKFEEIFKNGGFDVVIGNPPYVSVELMPIKEKKYYKIKYDTFFKRGDLFSLFLDIASGKLSKGFVSFIIPSILLNNLSYKKLRDRLLNNKILKEVCYTGGKIFTGVTVETVILIIDKHKVADIKLINALDFNNPQLHKVNNNFFEKYNNNISVGNFDSSNISDKIFKDEFDTLETHFNVFQGIVTGNNDAFIFENEDTALSNGVEKDLLKPLCLGRDIEKWNVKNTNRRIIYIDSDTDIKKYKGTENWLKKYKDKIIATKDNNTPWYTLHRPRLKKDLDIIPKIAIQRTRNESLKIRVVAAIDDIGCYFSEGIILVIPKHDKYSIFFLLGILNSKLINYLFLNNFLNLAIKAEYLKQLKLPSFNKDHHDNLVKLVDQMLDLQKKFHSVKTDHEQKIYKNQINSIDNQIDALVYELYGLTEDEIKIVEGK